jgi:40-residue YVTN family beta-propeller repeat
MVDNVDSGRLLLVANTGDDSISFVDTGKVKEIYRLSLLCSSFRIEKKTAIGPHCIIADKNFNNIYTANSFNDSISEINIRDMVIKNTFFAGCHPNEAVFSKDGDYLYISNGDSNSISIISMEDRKITTQISVGSFPHGICTSPNGEYIYTANMGSDCITVIDTWSNSKMLCIRVGEGPTEIMSSNDGRFLYVTCSFLGCDRNGTIAVISTSNFRVIKQIEVGILPSGMYLSEKKEKLYVSNMGNNELSVIDLKRFEIANRKKLGNMAKGIVSDGRGNIFVANSEDNNVYVIKEENLEIVNNIEVGNEPTSMLYIDRFNM